MVTLDGKHNWKPTLESIKEIVDSLSLEESGWDEFLSKIVVYSPKKNEVIKRYNSMETFMNIIHTGSVGYFVKRGQTDICTNIFYETEFFCDYESLLLQKALPTKTVALEDSEIYSIPYEEILKLYERYPPTIQIARVVAESLFIAKQEEQVALLTLTPEERYINLLQQRPNVLLRTPLKIIASYLGITPESLSRMRRRVSLHCADINHA